MPKYKTKYLSKNKAKNKDAINKIKDNKYKPLLKRNSEKRKIKVQKVIKIIINIFNYITIIISFIYKVILLNLFKLFLSFLNYFFKIFTALSILLIIVYVIKFIYIQEWKMVLVSCLPMIVIAYINERTEL